MRSQLVTALPTVDVLDGTAEHIPLSAPSVDAVVVAQAFHWFDAPAALAEVRRVLRSGGGRAVGLGVIWNERDEPIDWVRRFGQILVDAAGSKPYVSGTDWSAVVATAGGFEPLQHRTFAYDELITADRLVTRAGSTSFVSALPDDERATFAFPYVTHGYWCDAI